MNSEKQTLKFSSVEWIWQYWWMLCCYWWNILRSVLLINIMLFLLYYSIYSFPWPQSTSDLDARTPLNHCKPVSLTTMHVYIFWLFCPLNKSTNYTYKLQPAFNVQMQIWNVRCPAWLSQKSHIISCRPKDPVIKYLLLIELRGGCITCHVVWAAESLWSPALQLLSV